MDIYEHPLYYEIAFSFFDVKRQVDTFEKLARRFGRAQTNRFLDVACGPSLQLREIARRGHEAVGLDMSPEMLEYLSERAKQENVRIETVQADMCSFKLERKADFAFIMMGSLAVDSNEKLLSHLDSVANSLHKGGLYLIQNMAVDWTKAGEQSWEAERNGIRIKTSFSTQWKEIFNQIYSEKLSFEVDDHGRKASFESVYDLKFVFPQEFRTLVKLHGRFEYLGSWEGNESTWFLDRLLEKAKTPSNINMVLLRRE